MWCVSLFALPRIPTVNRSHISHHLSHVYQPHSGVLSLNDRLAPESHNAKVDSCFFTPWMMTGITGRFPLLFNEQNAEFASALCCGSSGPLPFCRSFVSRCSSRWCRLLQPLTPHALYVQSFTTCFPAKQQKQSFSS